MTANVHRRTPSLSVSDGRGLPIRQIAYLRTVAGETATALMTRQQYDVAGRLVAQRDPRLSRPNLTTLYSLSGEPLKSDSVDAGWRLSLPGLAGEALARWDARGSHWRTTYDNQLRVIALEENTQPNVEIYTYATVSADASHNLRGQLLEQVDPSGSLHLNSYGLLGQTLHETRTFHDAKAFASSRTYNPQGAVLEQIDAGEHCQQSRYDLAGQLRHVQLQLKGDTDWQPVLLDAQYNAAGQIVEQKAGNDIISTWVYDPANARLYRQSAQHNQQSPLQDFEYKYDPMGNITRILDHAFITSHFGNQRVDGHREFSYDSLYQLITATGYDDAPPSDLPGRPVPTAPDDRRNYTQTYTYDPGGNLIGLRHVRDGASHTREMFIDPDSNRGVRWTEGDPTPDFDKLFDRHGNLMALQSGQPLQWDARDQLTSMTLLHRDNGPDDEESYRYSQGVRVYKRHDTHTATTSHFHEVRYLPGLEIRTKDNGEELHVITLAAGFGSIRCLHWEKDPANIGKTQLRYTLDDHLGSCLMEMDQQAQLISHEGYYPFGATAWMTARSSVEVDYKTVRYSGKEMDVSGLYYYGQRYYAPWLGRWTQPDKSGTVDGLNLYRMTGNNPINFVDEQGAITEPPPLTPAQTSIDISSPSPSRRSSVASSTSQASNSPALVDNPEANPPGHLPPKPEQSWREWGKEMVLAAVNSKVGLAVLPTATSSPASPVIVTVLATNAALFIVNATLFNPGWSIASTWPQAEDGIAPSYEVTQAVNRNYQLTVAAANLVAAAVGAPLALLVGGYVDELRGTKVKADKKAQAGKWMDKIDSLIAEQRLVDEVSVKAQTSLREQVLEVEELIGITWQTMGMLEKIDNLRPGKNSESNASSRRGSISSQSTGDRAFSRRETSRTPVRKTNILR
ncbi:RHS repeat-associated core domain-containing protein [Pseudomonas lini]|uniref:RHS repeat-associated core domain-containing protein n=1 Tax=Pseudomonas lini TaxID=163011 RepID=UPI00345E3B3F